MNEHSFTVRCIPPKSTHQGSLSILKRNDGHSHRQKVRAGFSLHKWIKENNYPDSIRVLCFNCNFARAFYGGKDKICPHKLDKAREVRD